MTNYPIIFNGDQIEFEREHANTPPEERPDWPLPSFDARDWAKAFCKVANQHGYKDAKGEPIDEGWMIAWFANALMRGHDEHAARSAKEMDVRCEVGGCTLKKVSASVREQQQRST